MSWMQWLDELRQQPQEAVADLLRGAASVTPFERAAPHEFLLAILPRAARRVNTRLLGEPKGEAESSVAADALSYLDQGLAAWLLAKRSAPLPMARKLSAYAAQVCEALQWPLYFDLPLSLAALRAERAQWLSWCAGLTLSAYRDPEYDYWQVLAATQQDDSLQFFWHSFVVEAGRTRSRRYQDLGLLALARLPLSEDDSQRNLRLQIQALVARYQRRKGWGSKALEHLADALRSVLARNPSLNADNYKALLQDQLQALGDHKRDSVLSLLGLLQLKQRGMGQGIKPYKLEPPGSLEIANETIQGIKRATSLVQAWRLVVPLLTSYEDYLHKSGDAYHFVRALDRCARSLCDRFPLRDPEIQGRLMQWIHLALRLDADNPRLWMLWELALRKADQPQRAQWVLWEMTRRFPSDAHCRLDLARLLADSGQAEAEQQALGVLQQVLQLEPDSLHAHSTLAQLAIRRQDWDSALFHAQQGLRIDAEHEPSALLLATAYARRNAPGDLDSAIEHLQRFVTRYPGNLNAENYLGKLLKRQQQAAQGKLVAGDDDAATQPSPKAAPQETDAAWLAFQASLQFQAPTGALADRVLPLPQALSVALQEQDWQALEDFDEVSQEEFPLETQLWRYLSLLNQPQAPLQQKNAAREALQACLDQERQAPSYDSKSWLPYLEQHWQTLQTESPEALASGRAWLADLLARYQPLPAPLLA